RYGKLIRISHFFKVTTGFPVWVAVRVVPQLATGYVAVTNGPAVMAEQRQAIYRCFDHDVRRAAGSFVRPILATKSGRRPLIASEFFCFSLSKFHGLPQGSS
ncbi:hypothetical protein LCE44_28065, partial [Vibrio harveyi]